MAKKAASSTSKYNLSHKRAGRLYKLLRILSEGSATRAQLVRKLKVGARTFYRDVDLLRECGISIRTLENGYELTTKFDLALGKLPFPSPDLTFGEVVTLMKGRTKAHQKLKQMFDKVAS